MKMSLPGLARPQLGAEPLGVLHDAALRRVRHEQRLPRRLQRHEPLALPALRLGRRQQRLSLSSQKKNKQSLYLK